MGKMLFPCRNKHDVPPCKLNANLRLDKFPVDDVIFTGTVPEAEFRHERPEEYERLVASGRLDALRVPAPLPWQRKLAVVIGVLATAVGLTLVTLIVLAGVGVLRNG